jgi:hypothetical protein
MYKDTEYSRDSYHTERERERENNFEIQRARELRDEARKLREYMAELRFELEAERQKSEASRLTRLKSVLQNSAKS